MRPPSKQQAWEGGMEQRGTQEALFVFLHLQLSVPDSG